MNNEQNTQGRYHLIIDFMHLVYRAKSVQTYLTTSVPSYEPTEEPNIYKVSLLGEDFHYLGAEGGYIELDGQRVGVALNTSTGHLRTTTVYFVLRYIKGIIERIKKDKGVTDKDIDITICFDAKGNKRKERNKDYKANRNNRFDQDDYSDVTMLEHILSELGFNCIKKEGYEADDLVYWINKVTQGRYARNYILTNDMDLLYNIGNGTSLLMYRPKQDKTSYIEIDERNASMVLSDSYKIPIEYWHIVLYKALVGDTSDNIKGVKGFGKKSFAKIVEGGLLEGYTPEQLLDTDQLTELINNKLNFKDTQKEEALESLSLVQPTYLDINELTEPRPIDLERKSAVLEQLSIKKL